MGYKKKILELKRECIENIENKEICKKALKERCNQIANTINTRDIKDTQGDILDLMYKIIEVI